MKQNPKDILGSEILSEFKPSTGDLQRIKNVAIIGVGVMGRGIAQAIAQAGFDVIAVEKDDESLNNAKEKLEEALDYEIQRWAMTKSEKKSILSRIEWTTNIEDVKECELVIEAVDEDFDLKKAIFKRLDEICPPHTIFVSNTSTLSLTKISEATKRPDKIIGMHFLNPVPKVPLV
ncbi:3-hydroxyacyl-CoA dehydrogenase, NAD binding domain [Candidatus Kryptobacter tengchongensis]|nr:3-hydroxyacyl-CoA dehydrogenase, NAD binding domain [Candidatus Kryptobacter tengchongensis]